MTKLLPPPNDRTSRLIVSVAVGIFVLALVVLVAFLAADVDVDDSNGSSGRCAPAFAGTVDPVTCLPYGSTGAAAGTNNSGSSAQKPKAPAAKPPAAPKAPAPAAPKAPAAPAVKAPAPPPVRLTK
ncbi:pyruvate/2-oxoglutarate dehydrogenase complex dihydrolipoamide acyltransferase (E2) component [Streptomyces sp. SAI-119]|uniref:hypothetical protein n=1 Tax=Streptomyces sp. SAI-119 TaxID=2940541 RepID=UPI0024754520|nr:hypothetical protein [Streptomyces sp. SAI-119]MDH6449599.1 pyruvate/2-oxoglutarate dehydrogenase complex dihydrolipoamide acyltransferase (E2) component [Streptomyces sp. SAI-119]